jgi:hypothetical protein
VVCESAYSRSFVLTPEMRQYFGRLFAPLSGIESGADPWQEELFGEFVNGNYLANVCLPTGLGKTTVMHVWLPALAGEALNHPLKQ